MQLEILIAAVFVASALLGAVALTCGDELSAFSPAAALRGLRGLRPRRRAARPLEPRHVTLAHMLDVAGHRDEADGFPDAELLDDEIIDAEIIDDVDRWAAAVA